MRGLLSAAIILTIAQGISVSPTQADSYSLTEPQIRELICRPEYKWDCETMVWTSYRESRWTPGAINYDCYPYHFTNGRPYICYGLLQLIERPDTLDPYYNIQESYNLWLKSYNDPWGN